MAYTTINKSTDYFNTKLYTGNGGTQSITGIGHQPDFNWIKCRSNNTDHALQDIVRGNTKSLQSNSNSADATVTNGVTAFTSDGFNLGAGGDVNTSGRTYCSWNWKANGASSANTDGSINSTVSANTTSGFSIVKYTGTGSNATVGHGLGVAPSMIIFKRLVGSGWNWTVYHKSMGNNYFMSLNLTNAKSNTSSSTYFQDTTPTSSVFSIGNSGHLNGDDIIAYCFAEKQGYSKFGSYVGNGSATDGTFIYTGFKPAFVITKSTTVEAWQMTDSVRDKNVSPNFARLVPNLADQESTNTTWAKVEKFSNGFKIGGNDSISNESGTTYIYMAFGQSLVGSNNVPCTAR